MLPSPTNFRILGAGKWLPAQVQAHDTAQEFVLPGAHAEWARTFWRNQIAAGDKLLFNGELFRLDDFSATPERLSLHLSRTCYRDQIYCNAHKASLIRDHGEQSLAHGLGVSVVLVTADNYLPIIRRGAHLGEEPGKLDVIGGHAHPNLHGTSGRPELFRAIMEELETELNLPADAVPTLLCCGLVENTLVDKPDLVFEAHTHMTMQEIVGRASSAVEIEEISELHALPYGAAALEQFLATTGDSLTPSARACLQLFVNM